ncbi:hypothetical protein [Chryseobacterium sp. JM1]|uniref:hypothetical protein n=1 Tax=Chryseobacterium sp. JM1 TaxID=1233950 RepID=UPI0004E759BC|nr:hypothetical protein [Chryseobacterium sp. JM1]KFF16998.1 hypothetical protein IW22_21670 [Chryseobacterium sp. JM1]
MEKSELENNYETLIKILNDFDDVYYDYKNANTKNKRSIESRLNFLIRRAENLITENDIFYNIITGGDDRTDYERVISLEETFTLRYFSNDMSKILADLKKYIFNLEGE